MIDVMAQSYFLTIRQGISFEHLTQLVLRIFQKLPPEISDALRKLLTHGEYKERLEKEMLDNHGTETMSRLHEVLQLLSNNALLCRSVYLDSKPVITQVPLSFHFSFEEKKVSLSKKYVLSRFAYIRRKEDHLVLESPLSYSRVLLDHPLASTLLDSLRQPVSVNEACDRISGLPDAIAADLMNLLFSSSMICEVNDQGRCEEEESLDLQCWEFHDLLFHSRSRAGRHDTTAGGTYRFADRFDAPPALKKVKKRGRVELYKPDLERIQKEDPPYARVQEERRSIREYSYEPITDRQLGEFLYRVQRQVDSIQIPSFSDEKTFLVDAARRPYPDAGSLYELELYPVVNRCENIDAGLYYYEPDQHDLIRISKQNELIAQLLQGASGATMVPMEQIQVLMIITARFQRVSWKYSALAYSLILKNVGVLYQTMYLAATAMGLAPCAVGYGDSDVFAKAAGTEYYTETSVGEFLLGKRIN